MKNVNMPEQRVFFRHTALIFLAIHKVLLRQIALSGEKILRCRAYFHFSNKAWAMFEKCQYTQMAGLFRHTALIFLAIHQGLPRQIVLPSEKSLAAGRSAPRFLPFGETPVRRGKAGRCGGDGGERAAQCPDVAFRPRMPTRSRAAKKSRAGAAGSLNRTMPAIRAPRAPIPVQIA